MENSPCAHSPASLKVFCLSWLVLLCVAGKNPVCRLQSTPLASAGQQQLPSPAASQPAMVVFMVLLVTSVIVSSQSGSSHSFAIIWGNSSISSPLTVDTAHPDRDALQSWSLQPWDGWVPPCFWSTPPWLCWFSASHLWALGKKLLCPSDSCVGCPWLNSACGNKQE